MFKKIIAAALAAVTVTLSAGVAFAAENYKSIKNSELDYHYCTPGRCFHSYEGECLGLYAEGTWGFVSYTDSDHKNSFKYISITPYGITNENKYYTFPDYYVNAKGNSEVVISPNATINDKVAKVVYQGRIYRTSLQSSGIADTYLIGSFRSKCPIK